MKIMSYFIISAFILIFLPANSIFGQKMTRAEKKKEKAELMDQSYELMKTIVHSGSYKFTADRMFVNSKSIDLYSTPNNYIAIRNNDFSAWLIGLPGQGEYYFTTGKITDSIIIEKDNAHKILLELYITNSIKFGNNVGIIKLQFTIMSEGEAMLIVTDGTGAVRANYYGKVEPVYDN